MAEFLSSRMRDVSESATLKLNSIIKEMNSKGINVINFTAGEPDGNTPDIIKEAAIKALNDNNTKYTASNGILILRERIAKKLNDENFINCNADDVIVTNGGKQAIFNFFEVCLEENDEVLLPSPYWLSYPAMINLAGGRPVFIKTTIEDGYKISIEKLEKSITKKSKILVLNYPNNPTGVTYTKKELEKIAQFALKNKLLVLSDEVYEKLDYTEFCSFASIDKQIAKQTVTVNSLPKTYNMTGWRIGYATGPKEIIKAMAVLQGHSTSNINSISQYAALKALDISKEFLKSNLEIYKRRRDLMCDGISKINGLKFIKPNGAFYVFIDCSNFMSNKIKNSGELAEYILRKSHVGVVPGDAFGDDECIRISYPIDEGVIQEGCQRLKEGFAEL